VSLVEGTHRRCRTICAVWVWIVALSPAAIALYCPVWLYVHVRTANPPGWPTPEALVVGWLGLAVSWLLVLVATTKGESQCSTRSPLCG
jgi:hypothetical protein